jgi:DNA-binding transcriptional LysR family regulator
MRIEQLEYLAAVTRYGSLRRAGERLHISQPAISEAIRKLERELGVTLLDRHRSGARISLAGRELLQPIVDVLESVERLKAAAGDQLATRRLLRVGTVNAGTSSLVLPALHAFQQAHARVSVEIRNLQQDEIHVALAEGTLDVGLVNLLDGDDVPPEFEVTPLLTGRPAAVLPGGHPLAARAEVTADDLRGERFIAMRAGYLMYRFVHRLFGSDLPRSLHTTDGAEMGKMMVAEGIGLTVLPDYSVLGDPLERSRLIVTRPLAGDRTVVTMVALHRRRHHVPPAVLALLTHLRERSAEASGSAPAADTPRRPPPDAGRDHAVSASARRAPRAAKADPPR